MTGVMYRYPGLLAKIVDDARRALGRARPARDRRVVVRAGAACARRAVVPVPERFERLEETVQICRQMWSDDDGPYEGQHYQLAETLCSPRPLTRPRPPILIGGGGEKRTLQLVARYARRVQPVRQRPGRRGRTSSTCCAGTATTEGRDYDSITKTALYVGPAVLDNTNQFLADAQQYAKLGISELEVMPNRNPADFAAALAERVIPRLNGIG